MQFFSFFQSGPAEDLPSQILATITSEKNMTFLSKKEYHEKQSQYQLLHKK